MQVDLCSGHKTVVCVCVYVFQVRPDFADAVIDRTAAGCAQWELNAQQ